MRCASAAATPSAASAGSGAGLSRSSRVTMNCTCSFVALPVPHTDFLTVGRRILVHRDPRLLGGEQRDAARVAEHDGGAHVLRVEHVLDRDRVRADGAR